MLLIQILYSCLRVLKYLQCPGIMLSLAVQVIILNVVHHRNNQVSLSMVSDSLIFNDCHFYVFGHLQEVYCFTQTLFQQYSCQCHFHF